MISNILFLLRFINFFINFIIFANSVADVVVLRRRKESSGRKLLLGSLELSFTIIFWLVSLFFNFNCCCSVYLIKQET